jgi:hypothetical protein
MNLKSLIESTPSRIGWALLIAGLILIALGIALAQSLGTWKWALFAGAEIALAAGFFLATVQQRPQES